MLIKQFDEKDWKLVKIFEILFEILFSRWSPPSDHAILFATNFSSVQSPFQKE